MKSIPRLGLVFCAFLLFTSCTNGGGSTPKTGACGEIGLHDRIIDGTECVTTNSPIVQLTILLSNGDIATCSGTLLTSKDILTAAHCFLTESDSITITSASAQISDVDHQIASFTVHPDANVPQNDVAIARLGTPVNNATLPIVKSEPIQPDDIVSIFGFGLNEDKIPGVLRSGQMKIIGVNSQDFTANFGDDGSNVCFGDSGGPAVLKFKNSDGDTVAGVVGVTSFGTSASGSTVCGKGGDSSFANIQGASIYNFIITEVPDVGKI